MFWAGWIIGFFVGMAIGAFLIGAFTSSTVERLEKENEELKQKKKR